MSVLRRSSRRNIAYSACFVCEKDKLHYSKYGSAKQENLIRCELSSGEVSLKMAMMYNLESDDSSLVPAAKRLKIMISDKDALFADVLYHQHCYNKFTRDYKPAKSNREAKDNVEKATAEKMFFNATKTKSAKSKILLSSTGFA